MIQPVIVLVLSFIPSGFSHLSIGLFVCCLNLLALIVAAGCQEHEDGIFICTCARNQIQVK